MSYWHCDVCGNAVSQYAPHLCVKHREPLDWRAAIDAATATAQAERIQRLVSFLESATTEECKEMILSGKY